jgi:hypothetical protein
MAKLPPFCRHASHVRGLLGEGRRPEAVAYASEQLRQGVASRLFLDAVADLLEPMPSKRGRPKTTAPAKWLEIGPDFESMTDEGMTYEQARDALADKYGQGARTIERAVAFYRDAKAESDNDRQ